MPLFFKEKKERILIFGTGSGGVGFYKSFRGKYKILGFLDNNNKKHGETLFGYEIYSPENISSLDFNKIYIASDYYIEIYEQLTVTLGVNENNIEIFHSGSETGISPVEKIEKWLERHYYSSICHSSSMLSKILFFMLFFKKHSRKNVKLVHFDWLDNRVDLRVHTFRDAVAGCVVGPLYIGRPQPIAQITLPKIALYHFRNGCISSVSRSVLLPDDRFVIERVESADIHNADYSCARLIYHGKKLAIIRKDTAEYIEKGILINGGSETNYYHWMLEILSQLQFVQELPEKYDDYPILISSFSQKIAAVNMFIDNAGINRKFVFINNASYYQVGDLLMITPPNNLVPNLRNTSWSHVVNSYVRLESLKYLREIAFKSIKNKDGSSSPKRVFLARKNFIRKYNQDEIINSLSQFDFSFIYMEDLEFHEQVYIMSRAELIVGPTGAAWTNILFATSGAKALCWMASEAGDLSCFSNIASALDVKLNYINYCAGESDTRSIYYAPYKIDVNIIVDWVRHHIYESLSSNLGR